MCSPRRPTHGTTRQLWLAGSKGCVSTEGRATAFRQSRNLLWVVFAKSVLGNTILSKHGVKERSAFSDCDSVHPRTSSKGMPPNHRYRLYSGNNVTYM